MKANRIYVFVPRRIGKYKMPAGRMAAQVGHVSAALSEVFIDVDKMTTLVMEVADTKELEMVKVLFPHFGISVLEQRDNLPGSRKKILQAVATVPLTKKQSRGLKGFKLWTD